MICPNCKKEMQRMCYPTFPPQYGYECFYCGKTVAEETKADNKTVDVEDYIVRQAIKISDQTEIPLDKLMDPNQVLNGHRIDEWNVLKNEHKWAMQELKKEQLKRFKTEARIPFVFVISYCLGVIVTFAIVKIVGA